MITSVWEKQGPHVIGLKNVYLIMTQLFLECFMKDIINWIVE